MIRNHNNLACNWVYFDALEDLLSMGDAMESNLLENSLIHLLDSVNRLDEKRPDIISIKYAVVHLWRGTKLLLEKRLFDEHWYLIYKNYPNYPKSDFNHGAYAPLNFDDLKDRLYTFCGINIDEYNYVLNKIRKDYNKIELSQFMGSKVQIISNLVEVWPFIVDFISKHIDFSHDTYTKNLFNQTCEKMDSHFKFIQHKKNEINKVLLNKLKESYYAKPLKCPKCLQDAIPLLSNNNTKLRCVFCDQVIHWKQLAVECGSYLNYLGPFDCLNCSSQGVLQTEDQWICLSCCHEWEFEHINICNLCGARLVWAQYNKPYCKHCKCPIG